MNEWFDWRMPHYGEDVSIDKLKLPKCVYKSLLRKRYLYIPQLEEATDKELLDSCYHLGISRLRDLRIAIAEFRGEDIEEIKEFYSKPEKTAHDYLKEACLQLNRGLDHNNMQEIAEAMANLYLRMGDYVDAGFISNEAIESELMKEEK